MRTLKQILRKHNIRKSKLVIYTAIIGNYDGLLDPLYLDDNCDYICFTDCRDFRSDIWDIRYVEKPMELDGSRFQRKFKFFPWNYLEGYKYSFFIDGNVQILGSIREYIEKYSTGLPMLCLRHPERDCVYVEAQTCINLKKDGEEVIRLQCRGYRLEGYPSHNGLITANTLFRAHDDFSVRKVMDDWWNEVKTKSRRDQLSFNYVAWKRKFSYDAAPLFCYDNEYWQNSGVHKVSSTVREERSYRFEGVERIPSAIIGEVLEGREVAWAFTSNLKTINRIEIRFATYMRRNLSELKLAIENNQTHEFLFETQVDVPSLLDNAFASFCMDVSLEAGVQYVLRFVANNTENNNAITIYRAADDSATEDTYALIDGEKQKFDLCVNLYEQI